MVRPDNRAIAAEATFLRALTMSSWWVQMEDGIRVSSVAFFTYRREPGETSVYADTPAGREIFARRFPEAHAARFTAEAARDAGFHITPDPEGDIENSPEHFVLTFNGEARRKPYQRACSKIALASEFKTHEAMAIER